MTNAKKSNISTVFSAVSLLLGGYLYLEWTSIGFPDGYVSDFDRARQILYPIGMILSTAFAISFARMGRKPWVETNQKKILSCLLLFLGMIVFFVTLLFFLSVKLDHGQGG